MKKLVVSLVLGLTFAVAFATSASAQDVTLAYQFQRLSEDESHVNMPLGFNVDASVPIGGGSVSLVGQFDWSRKKETEGTEEATLAITGAGGGVRWVGMGSPSISPFVQGMVGVIHHKSEDSDGTETGNNFAFNIDGGVAIPLNDRVSAVGQVGYRWLKDDEPINFIRVVVGVRINLAQ